MKRAIFIIDRFLWGSSRQKLQRTAPEDVALDYALAAWSYMNAAKLT
jgi:hypothetical protein